MNKTKENKRMMSKKLLVSVIAVLTLLVCCAGCGKKTPREALDEAFEKTFSVTPEEELLGLEELNKAIAENTAYTSGATLTLEEISGAGLEDYADLLAGIGLSVDVAENIPEKQTETSIGISYGGTTYLTLGTQFSGSKFYMMIPQLLNGSISLDFATLAEDIASNELYSQSLTEEDMAIFESLDFDFWEIIEEMNTIDFTLPENITEASEELDAAIVVEEVKVADADLPTDISAKKAYLMTVPKDAYADYTKEVMQYVVDEIIKALSDESMQDYVTDIDMPDKEEINTFVDDLADTLGDIELTVAVTKAGYVSYIATEFDIEGSTAEFNMTFDGEKSPLEEVAMEISATVEDETVSLEFAQTFDAETKTAAYDIALSAMDFTATIEAEGEYTDIEKGKKYAYDLNYLEFDCSEDFSFTLSGSSYLDTTSCDIDTPAGTEYELFKVTEDELMALVEEVMTNMQNDPLFSEIFGLLGVEFPQ